jgi:Cof subfamily protein (haloacid dehalogenase superfamily)
LACSDHDDDSIYSLIALDIDGTMIGEDRIVHADLIAAIGRVQSLGAVVSIATGRALAPALRVAEQAGAAGPVICFQGAMTFDQAAQSEIRHVRLSKDSTTCAISGLTEKVSVVMMFLADDVWVERRNDWIDGYVERMGLAVRYSDSLISMADSGPTSIVGVGDPATIKAVVSSLRTQLDGSALVTHSLPNLCEVEAVGAGKGLAVEHLATHLGINGAHVVAVGDEKGDLTMIEWAGLGVAIEGGDHDLIAIADVVIARPEESGLAVFLESLCDTGKIGPSDL